MQIILASASPRRKELLGMLFADFAVLPAEGEEKATEVTPGAIAAELAREKAAEVAGKAVGESQENVLVIGADTIVVHNGEILGKPENEEDAEKMLTSLSGDVHQVYTGLCVMGRVGGVEQMANFAVCTDVYFDTLSQMQITEYIRTGEPLDKAGAYGIQGLGGRFIRKIDGDYYNVVGLPLNALYHLMLEWGVL